MPSRKTTRYWVLVHPNARDLAWNAHGWAPLADATVFSTAGKSMFKARRSVVGRWMAYPDVLTTAPAMVAIDLANPDAQPDKAPIRSRASRARNRLIREARAKSLRTADPFPTYTRRNPER